MKVKILIAAHKKTPILENDCFVPVHVGRSIASDKVRDELDSYTGDDSGDNISNKNVQYAEVHSSILGLEKIWNLMLLM